MIYLTKKWGYPANIFHPTDLRSIQRGGVGGKQNTC